VAKMKRNEVEKLSGNNHGSTYDSNKAVLVSMGFTDHQATTALEVANNDLETATDIIFSVPAEATANPQQTSNTTTEKLPTLPPTTTITINVDDNDGEEAEVEQVEQVEEEEDEKNAIDRIMVKFQSHYEYEEKWDDPDNISPYISLAGPADDIGRQRFPNEIVIPMQNIRVLYNYPLSNPVIYPFKADTPQGFTRAHLARKVADGYKRIFDEEEAAVGNPGHLAGMSNRASSSGLHGIWGHDLGNLMLHTVVQKEDDLFELGVDS